MTGEVARGADILQGNQIERKRPYILTTECILNCEDGGAAVGPRHSHVGDPAHCADHADFRPGATLRYHPVGERQDPHQTAGHGRVSWNSI